MAYATTWQCVGKHHNWIHNILVWVSKLIKTRQIVNILSHVHIWLVMWYIDPNYPISVHTHVGLATMVTQITTCIYS